MKNQKQVILYLYLLPTGVVDFGKGLLQLQKDLISKAEKEEGGSGHQVIIIDNPIVWVDGIMPRDVDCRCMIECSTSDRKVSTMKAWITEVLKKYCDKCWEITDKNASLPKKVEHRLNIHFGHIELHAI